MYLYYHNSINFGDYIAKVIYEKISGEKSTVIMPNDKIHYVVTGSIISNCNENSIVWGAGIANKTDNIPKSKYVMVRGKLTQNAIKQKGYECGDFVGDPLMLLPKLFDWIKQIHKEYEIGVIPHWIDYMLAMTYYRDFNNVNVIDLLKPWQHVVKEVSKCEIIISSSLHGIILSHALNIPCLWVEFSDKILGDKTKYYDYFSSVNIPLDILPYNLRKFQDIDIIKKSIVEYNININLDTMINLCPFKKR